MGDPEVLRAKGRLNTFKQRKLAKFWRKKNVFSEKIVFQVQFLFSKIF